MLRAVIKTVTIASVLCIIACGGIAQTIYTFAGFDSLGWTPHGYTGDGGPATTAKFWFPVSLAADRHGNLFIADLHNYCIRKVSPAGIITTVAGNGSLGFSGDGGPATAATLDEPTSCGVDYAGNIYIVDFYNYRIRKVDTFGTISTIAGNGTASHTGDGGPASAATLTTTYLAVDSAGDVFFSDWGNIREINIAGTINTIAGVPGHLGYSGDGGPALGALMDPHGLSVDKYGNIYLADFSNYRVRKIDGEGIITTIAGNGTTGFSGDGGPATVAQFSDWVEWVCADDAGNVFITDMRNDRVRRVDALGRITTYAGSGYTGYYGDGGPATAAQLYFIDQVARYGSGNVYIADRNNNVVRVVTDSNHAVSFTGSHSPHFNLCSVPTLSLDTLLAATDADTGQVEQWKVVYGPLHGALLSNYAIYSTGATVIPTGFTYTPNPGYSGFDTVVVLVTDGFTSDVIDVYLRVDDALPVAGLITGKDSVCLGDTMLLRAAGNSGTWAWSAANGNAAVGSLSGVVTGASLGLDTVVYILTNACGADTASFAVSVKYCPSSVNPVSPPDTKINVYPNPAAGAFTFSLPEPYDEAVTIIITNPLGEKVQQLSAMTNDPIGIQISGPPGIYFINAVTAHGVWSEKVIINR